MKRYYITTVAVALAAVLLFGWVNGVFDFRRELDVLKVGFIYQNDESAPYTYNFDLAKHALEKEYGDRVEIFIKRNVRSDEMEGPVRELVKKGCNIIFTNCDSDPFRTMAADYPKVEFCQVSYMVENPGEVSSNYHTFNGEIWQARYVSGIAAGMKLQEMIDSGVIQPEEALVGFVGAFPTAEIISGYTAFLLGVRSVVPQATMRVRYTGAWSSYTQEKSCTKALIDEGCVVISQHTDTIGPAVACEAAAKTRPVIHIGYHQSTIDVGPATSLISIRINWTPYVVGACEAMFAGKSIEKCVDGNTHGNDMSAGFERGWIEMLELNTHIAAAGTKEKMEQAIEAFRKGKLDVFKGNYIGVNPDDPTDTYDLSQGFTENKDSSYPTFHYVLKDIITVDET